MRPPPLEHVEPRSLEEACRLLERHADAARPIAGGTDLVPALKNRLQRPRVIVDLLRIPGLDAVRWSEQDGLSLGALVTLRRLASDPLVRGRYAALAEAAHAAGSVQLRAMGTLGGNLCQDACCQFFNRSPMSRQMLEPCHKLGGEVCHVVCGSEDCWAVYCGDLAPALLALDARVRVASPSGGRTLPVSELYSGDGERPVALGLGEIVAQVALPPPPPRSGGAYLKLRPREALDYPLLGVAAWLALGPEGRAVSRARVALTAVDGAPVPVAAAARLEGREAGDGAFREVGAQARKLAHPMKNVAALPPGYRAQMVEVYVRRALARALERAEAAP